MEFLIIAGLSGKSWWGGLAAVVMFFIGYKLSRLAFVLRREEEAIRFQYQVKRHKLRDYIAMAREGRE